MQTTKHITWITWGLLLVCLAQAAYIVWFSQGLPAPTNIVSVTDVGEGGAIYGVLYDSGSATAPLIYRYFLMAKQPSHEHALQKTRTSSPFLVTKNPNAVHEVRGNQVVLKTSGVIYDFHNTSFFKSNEHVNVVTFDLEASAP